MALFIAESDKVGPKWSGITDAGYTEAAKYECTNLAKTSNNSLNR